MFLDGLHSTSNFLCCILEVHGLKGCREVLEQATWFLSDYRERISSPYLSILCGDNHGLCSDGVDHKAWVLDYITRQRDEDESEELDEDVVCARLRWVLELIDLCQLRERNLDLRLSSFTIPGSLDGSSGLPEDDLHAGNDGPLKQSNNDLKGVDKSAPTAGSSNDTTTSSQYHSRVLSRFATLYFVPSYTHGFRIFSHSPSDANERYFAQFRSLSRNQGPPASIWASPQDTQGGSQQPTQQGNAATPIALRIARNPSAPSAATIPPPQPGPAYTFVHTFLTQQTSRLPRANIFRICPPVDLLQALHLAYTQYLGRQAAPEDIQPRTDLQNNARYVRSQLERHEITNYDNELASSRPVEVLSLIRDSSLWATLPINQNPLPPPLPPLTGEAQRRRELTIRPQREIPLRKVISYWYWNPSYHPIPADYTRYGFDELLPILSSLLYCVFRRVHGLFESPQGVSPVERDERTRYMRYYEDCKHRFAWVSRMQFTSDEARVEVERDYAVGLVPDVLRLLEHLGVRREGMRELTKMLPKEEEVLPLRLVEDATAARLGLGTAGTSNWGARRNAVTESEVRALFLHGGMGLERADEEDGVRDNDSFPFLCSWARSTSAAAVEQDLSPRAEQSSSATLGAQQSPPAPLPTYSNDLMAFNYDRTPPNPPINTFPPRARISHPNNELNTITTLRHTTTPNLSQTSPPYPPPPTLRNPFTTHQHRSSLNTTNPSPNPEPSQAQAQPGAAADTQTSPL